MKFIRYWIPFCLSAGLLTSACQSDLFDQLPPDRIVSENVWSDLNLTEAYLNGTYNGLSSGFTRGWYMLDTGTDDGENSYGWTEGQAFNRGDFTPSNAPMAGNFNGFYGSIRRTNLLLEKIDGVPGAQTRKDRIKGEARFLRAFFYAELIKQFGGVPLIAKSLTITDDLQLPRNTYKECVDFIAKECDEAATLLSAKYEGASVGRITKGAAMALKARMQLYAASPLNNAGSWADAARSAKAVMDLGQYSLYPNYGQLFLIDNNAEVILDRQYDVSQNSNYVNQFNNPIGYAGWGGTGPTQDFVDSYEMTDGKTIKDSPLYKETDPYVNRDPRFYATVNYEGAKWGNRTIEARVGGADGMEKNGDATKTGYYMRKFLDEGFISMINNIASGTNWIIIRYAEVLLNYAEAQNEAAGPDASVYAAMNQIRKRAGMPDLPAGLTKEQMRTRIQQERRIELAFEEHRFWDIRRWKIAEKVVNGPANGVRITKTGNTIDYKRFVFEQRTFDPAKHYLMPIPQSEIDKNKNLKQNPGW